MIIPTGAHVLVRPDPVETKTASGLYLAIDEKREGQASVSGELVSIGPLAWKEFVDGEWKRVYDAYASIGDKVQYKRYSGVFIKDPDNDEMLLLLNDTDVLARIEKGDSK